MKNLCNAVKRHAKKTIAAIGSLFVAGQAMAVDTTAVGASLTGAQTTALSVGELVIGVVAALIVIGLVISMVTKIRG